MKLPLSLLISTTLLLTACSLPNFTIGNPPTAPKVTPTNKTATTSGEVTTPTTTGKIKVSANAKQDVEKAMKTYLNPKIATLRTPGWIKVGKVYMQYDKKLDKTFFWAILDNPTKDKATGLTMWLVDNQATVEKDKKLSVGTIGTDKDGLGYIYFEFPEKGNFYKYLQVLVTKAKDPTTVFEANFNPKLS